MDCVTFLNFALPNSFSIRETIIVNGKLTASDVRFRTNVFLMASQKFLFAKTFSKTLNPIQGLSKIPLKML